MKRVLFPAIIIILCYASIAISQGLPANLTFLHNQLIKNGFALEPVKTPNVLEYMAHRCSVGLYLDAKGVKGGTIVVLPGDQISMNAIAGIYIALQMRLKKDASLMVPGAAERKGFYLMDTVRHNLAVTDYTAFAFDDMWIEAAKSVPDKPLVVMRMRSLF